MIRRSASQVRVPRGPQYSMLVHERVLNMGYAGTADPAAGPAPRPSTGSNVGPGSYEVRSCFGPPPPPRTTSKSPRNTAAPERASANFRSVTAASVPLLWKQTSGQSSCKANQAHRSAACRHRAPPQRGGMVPRTGQPCAQPRACTLYCVMRAGDLAGGIAAKGYLWPSARGAYAAAGRLTADGVGVLCRKGSVQSRGLHANHSGRRMSASGASLADDRFTGYHSTWRSQVSCWE